MGTREHYDHGVFSYVELGTSDAAAAKDFYSTLFGWTYEDVPVGEGMTYHPASKNGQRVAALHETQQHPTWLNYVTVDDLEATAGKVEELGGSLVQAPFDVMDQGRMAVLQDPTGAVLALWEARKNAGAQLVNAPGAFSWNDLQTTDVDAAATFYAELLGWDIGDVEGAPDERRLIKVGDGVNGGMAKLAAGLADNGVPSHWLTIFAVEDVDATVSDAEGAGGTVMAPGMDLPNGRMAVLADPGGVPFAIFAGEFDD